MSRIHSLDQGPQEVSDFADAHHIDLDHHRIWSEDNQGIIIPGLPQPRRDVPVEEIIIRRRSERSIASSIASEHEEENVGMRTATRGLARGAKQLADGSKAKEVDIQRSDDIEKSVGSAATGATSRNRDESTYIALQHDGFIQATSTRGSTRMWINPASEEELSQLVVRQRSQGKDFSVLTNYRLLNHNVQNSVFAFLEGLRQNEPHMKWAIESIDITKGRRTHLSRRRRQQSEQALIIVSGRPRTDQRDSKVRSHGEIESETVGNQQSQRGPREQREYPTRRQNMMHDPHNPVGQVHDAGAPVDRPPTPRFLLHQDRMERSPFQRETRGNYSSPSYNKRFEISPIV